MTLDLVDKVEEYINKRIRFMYIFKTIKKLREKELK